MKCYENRDNFRERVHTIQVTFQSGEYKGRIAYKIGGNVFGIDLLGFDLETLDEDIIKNLVVNDCDFSFDYENEVFSLELKNESGDSLLCEEDDYSLGNMVVALEIIDCKIVDSKNEEVAQMDNEPIIRTVDDLSRIVIPKEIRNQIGGIEAGTKLEITVTEDRSGILLNLIK